MFNFLVPVWTSLSCTLSSRWVPWPGHMSQKGEMHMPLSSSEKGISLWCSKKRSSKSWLWWCLQAEKGRGKKGIDYVVYKAYSGQTGSYRKSEVPASSKRSIVKDIMQNCPLLNTACILECFPFYLRMDNLVVCQ